MMSAILFNILKKAQPDRLKSMINKINKKSGYYQNNICFVAGQGISNILLCS
jgi:hypothetical protein